ncbi:MAG TPA: YiiX/YebB-like N1pC/P60 family cysteine hydrolase [Bryobacteraceae bacterium]|nr:YiiX/YebB-like N1pC/P60 family cysteine hydrolase [Bryobacteraceae bacterium]
MNTVQIEPSILLFKGRGFLSKLIQWQTRGRFSHAAIMMRDGSIVEAWQGKGVRVQFLTDYSNVERFVIPSMTDAQWDKAIAYAMSQVGKKYDYWAIIRFISRTAMPENDHWFCSELVIAALNHADVFPFVRMPASEISPGLLHVSPLLVPKPLLAEKV